LIVCLTLWHLIPYLLACPPIEDKKIAETVPQQGLTLKVNI